MNLTIDDFKQILLDLYLAQRENAELRARMTQQKEEADGLTDREGEVI